jgi:phosphatidylglycerophosphatase A
MKALLRFLAAGLGTGYVPLAPGTAGSLLAIPLYLALGGPTASLSLLLSAGALLTLVGLWACHEGELAWGHDPSRVVIDEVAGQYWTLVIAATAHPLGLFIAFLLFRLFDIWKPWLIDKLQNLPGAWGVMCDDLLAGVVGGLILRLAIEFSPLAALYLASS